MIKNTHSFAQLNHCTAGTMLTNDSSTLQHSIYHPVLLSLAKIYGKIRHIPGIWQQMATDIIQVEDNDILSVAHEMHVTTRTIRRIVAKQTRMPSIETSFKLFMLHMKYCYTQYKHT